VEHPAAAGRRLEGRRDLRVPHPARRAAVVARRQDPGYRNKNTHWWDGSQIYGSTEAETQKLRGACRDRDGRLEVDVENPTGETFLPRNKYGIPRTGFSQNWWLGLELLHTLFALEHNAIASLLRVRNPTWTPDQLFDTARLINCALMAKIHMVEWTPAILQHPALDIAMHANWWGLVGEKLWHVFGRVFGNKSEVLSGIPGSGTDHDKVPYSLTEEFVSVYRLHPLIPDDVAFFRADDGTHQGTIPIRKLAFQDARLPFEEKKLGFADAFYSFGVNFPGAIRIHNMPNFLRDLTVPADDEFPHARHLDLGAVDILRDRERGIPRYNKFRQLLHMPKARSFEQLTGGDKVLAAGLREVYDGDLDAVDLLVGSLCEPLPEGFGFSDTAFRLFILMASRRIKSDRFLAGDGWCPEVYTREGIEWVQKNSMKDVLCRHFPELRATLRNVKNVSLFNWLLSSFFSLFFSLSPSRIPRTILDQNTNRFTCDVQAFEPWEKLGATGLYVGKETNTPEEVAAAAGSKKNKSDPIYR
jgi:hypothetical protein